MGIEKRIKQEEDACEEQFLPKSIRDKLKKWGYKSDLDLSTNKIIITNKKAKMHFGYNTLRGVYFFSLSSYHPLDRRILNGMDGECMVKIYPTKLEITKDSKEWHIGFNGATVYNSFSSRFKEVAGNFIECARFYRK